MAEAVEPQLAAPTAAREARRRRSYGGRFLVAYLLLALAAAVAVAASVVLLTRDPPENVRWSAWQPTGPASAEEIAAHVAPRYRLPTGSQMAAVLAGAPSLPVSEDVSLDVTHVAIVTGEGETERIDTYPIGEKAVVYRLCGLGENCALAEGELTDDHVRVLRREALELALYTFTYLKDTETVVVVLPQPPTPETPTAAVLFRQEQLANELQVPLAATLAGADDPAAVVREVTGAEARRIDRLTLTRLFRFEYRLTPDASGFVLVLAPGAA